MALNLKDTLFKKLSSEKLDVILQAGAAACGSGYNIYLIGGIVRDLIMDNPIYDIDIAIEGDAEAFVQILKNNVDCEIINMQKNLKTVKIRFANFEEIDFASTREELYTQSGVLPKAFNFGCPLKNDVKRRDFTINTLAIKLTGEDKYFLVDYFGGYDDIIKRHVKVLHERSFIDDPSRIIRALKFSERFKFEIECETYGLMKKYLENINQNMPLERIKHEFKQYFSIKSENPKNLYKRIIDTNTYKLVSTNAIKRMYTERLPLLKSYKLINEEDFWFIYFTALTVNSEQTNAKLNMNNFEKKVLRETKELLYKKISSVNNKEIYDTFIKCADLSLACFYILAENKMPADKFLKKLKKIKTEINGNDLIEIGLTPSPYFHYIFEQILEKKLNGEIKDKQNEIEYARRLISELK